MDKKVFVAVTLCAGIFLVWQNYYVKPMMIEKQQASAITQAAPNQEPAKLAISAETKKQNLTNQSIGTEKQIKIGNEKISALISTKGGVIQNLSFDSENSQKQIKTQQLIGSESELKLTSSSEEWAKKFDEAVYKVVSQEKLADGNEKLVLNFEDPSVAIKRTYQTKSAQYLIESETTIQFKTAAPNFVFLSTQGKREVSKDLQENERRKVYFNKIGGIGDWEISKLNELKEDLGEGKWVAITSRYFVNAIIDAGSAVKPQFQSRPTGTEDYSASLIYKVESSQIKIPTKIYFGPKNIELLKSVEKGLDAVVDFGWFTFFAFPMLSALKWLHGFVGNYGVAIILLTVLIKVLTYPLTLKSMKSMKEMQRIQPQLNALKEKHANDKEKLNKEMLELMKTNGYNPMSGCLPMLIQMPIFIALYNVLYGAIDLYGQPFFGWIHDLSAKDPYYVTPVLLALMMFLQQKLTPQSASVDPAQQKMMTFMPLIFGVMMLWLPAGLTLYMLVNSVVSILQQFVVNRTLAGASVSKA